MKFKCPVCKKPAEMRERTEDEYDGPGSTTYVFMECTKCGIRSEEGIGFNSFRDELEKKWAAKK